MAALYYLRWDYPSIRWNSLPFTFCYTRINFSHAIIYTAQLFYLHHLDFGTDTPGHENISRIGVYNDSMIAEFIDRDVILKNRKPFPAYGKMKVKSSLLQVVYSYWQFPNAESSDFWIFFCFSCVTDMLKNAILAILRVQQRCNLMKFVNLFHIKKSICDNNC